MNEIIMALNRWSENFASFGYGMLIQSSMLIVVLASIDFFLRNKTRAVVRYSLWMLLLVKLVLPVSFSLPTSIVWITRALPFSSMENKQSVSPTALAPVAAPAHLISERASKGAEAGRVQARSQFDLVSAPAQAALTPWGWAFVLWLCVSFGLMIRLIAMQAKLRAFVKSSFAPSDELKEMLRSCCEQMRVRQPVGLRMVDEKITPAVCGVFRPCILLPRSLPASLETEQVRAVLLHELAHVKRGDVLVNFIQTLLQIFYFFHPLLWVANRRIRKLREQAVDETVLATLGRQAEVYPMALLNVAKFAFNARPMTLGALGMMERRSAFEARVRRMLALPFPSDARVGKKCAGALVLLALCVLPMGNSAKEKEETPPTKEGTDRGLKADPKLVFNGIAVLEEELERARADLNAKQKVVDDLRLQLGLSDIVTNYFGPKYVSIRTLQQQRFDAEECYAHFQKLADAFKAMSRSELRKAIPSAFPDAAIDRYLADLAKIEQQYAGDSTDYSSEHPVMVRSAAIMKTINRQIEERIDGILAGLDVKLAQCEAQSEFLQKQIQSAKKEDQHLQHLREVNIPDKDGFTVPGNAQSLIPYLQAKRDMENQQRIYDTIFVRLLAEKLDAQLPPNQPATADH